MSQATLDTKEMRGNFKRGFKKDRMGVSSQGSDAHDLSTAQGLVSAALAIMCTTSGALVHFATVCTSFTFINRGTHGRSIAFPLGRSELEYVALGSALAARSALLAMLAWARGCCFVLEQPLRSIMTALPSWQGVIGFFEEAGHPLKMNSLNMAAFRAPTLKPTALYSAEDLQWLMDMPTPPKDQRPPLDSAVWRVKLGFQFV